LLSSTSVVKEKFFNINISLVRYNV